MNKKLIILLSSLLVIPLFSACGHTHEYGEWKTTKVATCIQEGEEKRTCECGESETRTVNKTEHTIVKDEAKVATCLEGGKTEGSHCSICDLVVVAQEDIEALGHEEVIDEAVPATCLEEGKTQGSHCSRCEEVLVEQTVIDALGHSFTEFDEKVGATVTTEGKISSQCDHEGCNEVIDVKQMKTPLLSLSGSYLRWHAIPNAEGYNLYCDGEFLLDVGDVLTYNIPAIKGQHDYTLEAYTTNEDYYEKSKLSDELTVNIFYGEDLQSYMRTNFEGFINKNRSLSNHFEHHYANFGAGSVDLVYDDEDNYSAKLMPITDNSSATITKECGSNILKAGTYRVEFDVQVVGTPGVLSYGFWNGVSWLPTENKTIIDLSSVNVEEWTKVTSEYTFDVDQTGEFANLDIDYRVEFANENYVLIDNFKIINTATDTNVDLGNGDFEMFKISTDGLLTSTGWKQDANGDVIFVGDKFENELVNENGNTAVKMYTSNTADTSLTFAANRTIATIGLYSISIKVKLGSAATMVDNIGFRFSSPTPIGTEEMVFPNLETLSSEEWVTLECVFGVGQDFNVDWLNIDLWVFTHNDVIASQDNYVLIDNIAISRIYYEQI